MHYRPLESTGFELSLIGLGGIALDGLEQETANALVAEAVDRGVTYFDSSPSYGNSESRLGPALAPYRDRVFLACKTERRTAVEARRELEESLRRLHTDHFDLYQVHQLDTLEDMEVIFGPGGAMETFEAAQREGTIRLIGFSTHYEMMAVEMLRRYPFASLLFPFTYASWYHGYGPQAMEAAKDHRTARLSMKSFVRSRWPHDTEVKQRYWWYRPTDDPAQAALALRFALSLDVTACISPGLPQLFRMALDVAETFEPLTPEEWAQVETWGGEETALFPMTPEEWREQTAWEKPA
jgi:aryl-alcohol dehydrogenase-like predicted oxidoreductase